MHAASLQDTWGGTGVATATNFTVRPGQVGSKRFGIWWVRTERQDLDGIESGPSGLVPRVWVIP